MRRMLVVLTAGMLASSTARAGWPDDVSLLEPAIIDWQRVLGHRQVTDSYLLALAVRHRGRFVTFDGRIAVAAVAGARAKQLAVLV